MAYIQISTMLWMLRKDRNLTRKQVAEAIGVHAHTYANWENGYSYPNILDAALETKR